MSDLTSSTLRIHRTGNEFSESNKKLIEAVHSFLNWFVPIVRWERLPLAFTFVNDNGTNSLGFPGGRTIAEHRLVRADGVGCTIQDYHEFCIWYVANEDKIIAWLTQLTEERRGFTQKLEQVGEKFATS